MPKSTSMSYTAVVHREGLGNLGTALLSTDYEETDEVAGVTVPGIQLPPGKTGSKLSLKCLFL